MRFWHFTLFVFVAFQCACLTPADLQGGNSTESGADPGVSTIRRLNRSEYNNTVRDLLGDTTLPANNFPADNLGGFDNNADVLTISTVLAQAYSNAAASLVDAALAKSSAQRQRILSCDPSIAHDACAHTIISDFATRAFRRPVSSDELEELFALVGVAEQNGDDVEMGIKLALQAVLVDPNFLFRVELDEEVNASARHRLSQYELASRMSYFIYGSMPDEALFAAARAGKLNSAEELRSQTERMLADTKASSLVESFATQWLFVNRLAEVKPSPTLYPNFNEDLRNAMAKETQMFFAEFLNGDRDFTEMFAADFTFVNGTLAKFYGIDGVSGEAFQKVSLLNHPRGGGLLTQASILTATSTPVRASISKRGRFVLSQLLCEQAKEAPPGIAPLPDKPMVGQTLRQQLDVATAAPACASCHASLNPLGAGLGHFDGVGAWQAMEGALEIDASGKLSDGTVFDGASAEGHVLRANPSVQKCVTRQALSYALGRELTQAVDVVLIDKIASGVAGKGNRMKELIVQIVGSDAFVARHGGAL